MLSGLRDSSGRPSLAVRALALLVALMLAAPITVLLLRGGQRLLGMLL